MYLSWQPLDVSRRDAKRSNEVGMVRDPHLEGWFVTHTLVLATGREAAGHAR
jgi:hypothetical protein